MNLKKLAPVAAVALAFSATSLVATPAFAWGSGGGSYCGCQDGKGHPGKSGHKKAKGNNGFGNGGHDGSPNGKQDKTR